MAAVEAVVVEEAAAVVTKEKEVVKEEEVEEEEVDDTAMEVAVEVAAAVEICLGRRNEISSEKVASIK